jgi:hypothetical protein
MAKNENGGPDDRQIMARFRASLSVSIETDRRRFDPVSRSALDQRSRWAPFGERGALHDAGGFARAIRHDEMARSVDVIFSEMIEASQK